MRVITIELCWHSAIKLVPLFVSHKFPHCSWTPYLFFHRADWQWNKKAQWYPNHTLRAKLPLSQGNFFMKHGGQPVEVRADLLPDKTNFGIVNDDFTFRPSVWWCYIEVPSDSQGKFQMKHTVLTENQTTLSSIYRKTQHILNHSIHTQDLLYFKKTLLPYWTSISIFVAHRTPFHSLANHGNFHASPIFQPLILSETREKSPRDPVFKLVTLKIPTFRQWSDNIAWLKCLPPPFIRDTVSFCHFAAELAFSLTNEKI